MPATLTIDLNIVLTVCSLVAIIVVWIQATRGTARMEGRHQKELEVMRDRLQHIETDMDAVKECNQTLDNAVIQIQTDIAWIKDAVAEIKSGLAAMSGGRRNTDA